MRLIDADALDFDGMSITQIVDAVQDAATVDAVEVVRCRDCVHFTECLTTENDYCSKGERKETTYG